MAPILIAVPGTFRKIIKSFFRIEITKNKTRWLLVQNIRYKLSFTFHFIHTDMCSPFRTLIVLTMGVRNGLPMSVEIHLHCALRCVLLCE